MALQLIEMQTAHNWRGIAAQEGAALALARDVRVADPSMASAILCALGCAHQSLGDFSQAIEYLTQDLAIVKEVGDRAGMAGRTGTSGNAPFAGGLFSGDQVPHAGPGDCQGGGRPGG